MNNKDKNASYMSVRTQNYQMNLPAIVFRNMRYSKLEISLLCQRCVMFEDLKSWRGVAKEIRLRGKHWIFVIVHILFIFLFWKAVSHYRWFVPGLWKSITRSYPHPWEAVDDPFDCGLVGKVKHHRSWRERRKHYK